MPVMRAALARRAGTALAWKALQLAAVKGLFLVRTLILARLLSPDDFGLFAIASMAVLFLMTLTELWMTSALVQYAEVDEAHYDSAWTVNVLRALCVSAVLLVAAPAIAALFAEPRATNILRLLALKPLIDGGASIKIADLMRTLAYRRLAGITVMAAAVETLVSVLLAERFGVWALAAGTLAGAVSGMASSYILAPHRPRFLLTRAAIHPLIRYGRWLFLTGLVAIAASSLTQVVISRQLGPVELGLYFLAAKLAFLPHDVATQVLGDVAFSVYARIQDDRIGVAKAFRSIFLGMTTVLLPAYVLLICVAPRLVGDVLGDRWNGTETIIQLLAIVGIIGLFGDSTGPLFRGLGYPHWLFSIELCQSSLVVVLLWTLTGRYGVLGAALAWLIATSSSQVVSFILARRILRNPLAGSALSVGSILVASLIGALTAGAVTQRVMGVTGLLIAVCAAASTTMAVLWFCDQHFELGLRRDLSQAFPQVASLLGAAPATR
jgi:O-antigen/teichoic acid export membrane protein